MISSRFSRSAAALLFMFLCVASQSSFAASPKVERIGPASAPGLSDALRQVVEARGHRVTLDDGWKAEFWFAKELKTTKQDVPGALYPELTNSEFVGIANFPQGISDFRGQSVPAGVYTLRYQSMPQDGNHMGVSPNPDFLLASPVAADFRPEQSYVLRKLSALSAKSTGTNHPAVLAMESAGEAATLVKNEAGLLIFSVAIPSGAGASEKIGIVLKGSATQ